MRKKQAAHTSDSDVYLKWTNKGQSNFIQQSTVYRIHNVLRFVGYTLSYLWDSVETNKNSLVAKDYMSPAFRIKRFIKTLKIQKISRIQGNWKFCFLVGLYRFKMF